MLSEFQKSIRAVLYDRLTSPLAGTFFFSWLVWNWGLLYYVISVDNTKNVVERIEYIKNNFLFVEYAFVLPLLSTIFLIFIYPYAAFFVYEVALKFNKQKRNIKNKIENEQCLTIRESLEIREEIEKQEDKFQVMTRRNNDEIKRLKQEVESYKDKLKSETTKKRIKNIQNSTRNIIENSNNDDIYDKDFLKFKETEFSKDFIEIANIINSNSTVDHTETISYFLAAELIEHERGNYYELTKKGNYFLKRLYEEQKSK